MGIIGGQMSAIDKAMYQLRIDEGFRALAYRDSKHLLTIGYGRCLDTNPLTEKELEFIGHDCRERPITKVQAEVLLKTEVEKMHSEVLKALPWAKTLDDTRLSALVNLAFNMGVAGLLKFKKTLGYLEGHEYDNASKEVLNSQWKSDVGPHRSRRIAEMLRLGDNYD